MTTYGEVKDFLEKHTKVLELYNARGARVAVTPEYQGRVMTTTCGGLDGPSFGYINVKQVEAKKIDKHFANYGAEDRMWLSPEGGQFSLWFKPGVDPQTLKDWYTPPAFNEGPWRVVSQPSDPFIRMSVDMNLENASGAKFYLKVARAVRLLTDENLRIHFGESAAAKMLAPGVKMVAYETVNEFINQGEPMTKKNGLVSIWILGMMNAGPETVVIVPYKPGDEATMGHVVKSDYFGQVPADRLKITPEAVLFRADGGCRSKIGVPQARAKDVLGSIDFKNRVLTLVNFNMPSDPTKAIYLDNAWVLPQKHPFVGDVVNSYNDGPEGFNGGFYEIESLSPAKELNSGEGITHMSRTLHIQADLPVLEALAKEILGVDLNKVRAEMLTK
ncbi:MAG: hypothetical protein JXB10_00260 [Pirellulales bacterium]|nr:hypothetical protein [Pirellulales bacterium]